MNDFLSSIARVFSLAPAHSNAAHAHAHGVAESLMERADACASRNPLEAQQLRGAAYAFLRVVR